MKAREELTFRIFVALWLEFLEAAMNEFIERHVVLRAIRIRTALSSPFARYRKARKRKKIVARLKQIERDLEQIADARANDFKAEARLQKDQALLQSDLLNL